MADETAMSGMYARLRLVTVITEAAVFTLLAPACIAFQACRNRRLNRPSRRAPRALKEQGLTSRQVETNQSVGCVERTWVVESSRCGEEKV